jgi:hypothetical protein
MSQDQLSPLARAALVGVVALGVAWPSPAAARRRAGRGRGREVRAAVVARSTPPASSGVASSAVGPGHVTFVTEKRAYLDRGADHGLAVGQSVALSRGGRAAGACAVEALGPREATCAGGHPRVGDSFRASRAPAKVAASAPALPAVTDEETRRAWAGAVAAAPYAKVDFDGHASGGGRAAVSVSPGFTAWVGRPETTGDTFQERLDGAVGVPLGETGLRFDAAFSAMRWQTSSAERFRGGAPTQFYLWEAEISRREPDGRTVLSVGRMWPWHLPGLPMLDGVQLGRQNEARSVEAGVYAGALPTSEALRPTTDAWAAGGYASLAQAGDGKGVFRAAREELRAGVWNAPGAGLILEGEGLAQAWLGAWSLGASGRASWARDVEAAPVLERASVDLASRASGKVAGGVHLRTFGRAPFDAAPLRGEVASLAGSVHGVADVRCELDPALALAASAGAHRDGGTGRAHAHAGGEVRMPRLFGERAGVWLGGEAEAGWLRGVGAYAQLVARARDRLALVFRLSASATEFTTPTTAANVAELGGYLHLDGPLGSSLRLRAWSLARVPVAVEGGVPGEVSWGLASGGSLVGTF